MIIIKAFFHWERRGSAFSTMNACNGKVGWGVLKVLLLRGDLLLQWRSIVAQRYLFFRKGSIVAFCRRGLWMMASGGSIVAGWGHCCCLGSIVAGVNLLLLRGYFV